MQQYLDLLKAIKKNGVKKPAARKGMPGTLSLFGYQFRHNLQEGFPLLTTKKMFFKGVVYELLWFLNGDTHIKYLVDNKVNIWNEDAYNYYVKLCNQGNLTRILKFENFIQIIKESPTYDHIELLNNNESRDFDIPDNYTLGSCGYQYGYQWRFYGERQYSAPELGEPLLVVTDQIKNLIKSLRETPESRRHIITAMDPVVENYVSLYPCHSMFQFNCRPISRVDRKKWIEENNSVDAPRYYLDCQLYQRSGDVFLGVPFNIASYALLTHIIAKLCNMIPGEFVHTFGDVHIYENHMKAVNEQLKRKPMQLPKLDISEAFNFKDLDLYLPIAKDKHFKIIDYNPHPSIKAELSTGKQ